MRRILVDAARTRKRIKRGGDNQQFEIRDDDLISDNDEELLALDEALELLRAHDPVKADLVSLRFFAGLTNKQAAEQLDISTATAERYWAYSKAWLRARMDS
jgi:RNA polymerase sigma factor (TIGR02999 family)